MNTISTNRANPAPDTDIGAIIDVGGRMMQRHSAGTALIDGLMADDWDGGDPWGSTMEASFALEYACQFHGLPTHTEFSSPYTTGDPDDGPLYVELRDAIEVGEIDDDDIIFARDILDVMRHAFKAAGLSY